MCFAMSSVTICTTSDVAPGIVAATSTRHHRLRPARTQAARALTCHFLEETSTASRSEAKSRRKQLCLAWPHVGIAMEMLEIVHPLFGHRMRVTTLTVDTKVPGFNWSALDATRVVSRFLRQKGRSSSWTLISLYRLLPSDNMSTELEDVCLYIVPRSKRAILTTVPASRVSTPRKQPDSSSR